MKSKILIWILIIGIIITSSMFISTLIDYFKTKEDANNESISSTPELTDNQNEKNETVIQVDEDSSIIVVNEYDEAMFKGKKSLVFFWASWCSHCQEELHVVKTAITDYQNRGYNIYLISHDYKTSELANFMKNNDLNYNVYFDEQRVIRANFDPEASSVPLTYIIDENARLIDSYDGPITLEELNKLIDKNM